jgi:hypothetical protein
MKSVAGMKRQSEQDRDNRDYRSVRSGIGMEMGGLAIAKAWESEDELRF